MKIDADFGLALLGAFVIVVIMLTILLVTQQHGIRTYAVLPIGSPCVDVYCDNQRWPAKEVARDWQQGTAYCQCDDGSIRQARIS